MFNSVLENRENRLQMKASSKFYPPNLGKLTCDPCPQAAGVNSSPGAALPWPGDSNCADFMLLDLLLDLPKWFLA